MFLIVRILPETLLRTHKLCLLFTARVYKHKPRDASKRLGDKKIPMGADTTLK